MCMASSLGTRADTHSWRRFLNIEIAGQAVSSRYDTSNALCRECATGEGVELSHASAVPQDEKGDPALIASENGDATKIASRFIKAIAQHRNWDREKKAKISA